MIFSTIKPKHILICRNDALGDTILALPTCGMIKKHYPDVKISFLGRSYTKDVVALSKHIDHFINFDEIWKRLEGRQLKDYFRQRNIDTAIHLRAEPNIAKFIKETGIKYRVGNLHYQKHLWTCNRFNSFGKSNSGLNEAQLDIKMLGIIGIKEVPALQELPFYYGIQNVPHLNEKWAALFSKEKFNLIIHPMMTGHEREWGTENFTELITLLGLEKYQIFITGSPQEGETLRPWLDQLSDGIIDLTGQLSMQELLAFIAKADGLIGGSTGPTHVAGAMGIHVMGLYTNRHAQDAARWGPVGIKAETLSCDNELVRSIPPERVYERLALWEKSN